MKKCGKTALSLLLSVSMGVATVTPVMASPARGEPELNPLVAVIEKVNSGDTLNLTEEGTLDWVHITGKEINRKSGDEELIQWENLDADSALSTAGDSAMAYTWTDGTPVVEKTNDTHAGVFNYRGIETGVVEEDAGYRISIPAADETRTLTFVSGIWQASAEIGITVNEDEKPVYTTQLKAGGSAEMNKYTVTVREGNEVTITTKIKEKTHKDGNLSLGGIALKTVEPSPIAVKVQDVSSLPKLNLTERGDVDWIHFEGEKGVSQEGVGTTVRKKDVDSQVTYQKLSDDETTTMSDAKVKYTWTDGTPIESAEDNTTGAVFTYKNGDKNSIGEDITSPAGYELKVAPAEYDRELVFVSGVWSADASISIKLDGEETPVYENNELTAGGEGANKVYTVALAAGKGMTVTGQIKKKSNEWGNFNLQAAALSTEKTLNDYKVLLQEKVNEAKALDLADYEEFYANQLNAEIQYAEGLLETESTNAEYYTALLFLTQAYESCLKAETKGSYMYETNPHFLFNVLLTIQIKAKRSGNETIYKMVSKLSALLRASIYTNNVDRITVGEELEYTEFYLYLQKMRFEDRFFYKIIVEDEELKKSIIPKFVIEPIVENAVIHGIENIENEGVIRIVLKKMGTDLLVTVQDNGAGFDVKEYFNSLEQAENGSSREKIGLKNVDLRLRHIYGEEYRIKIKSKINTGTTIYIKIPIEEREENV